MKTTTQIAILSAFTLIVSSCSKQSESHSDHGHDHSVEHTHSTADHNHSHESDSHHGKEAGPNGGRVITSTDPHLEFFLKPDRHVQITLLDKAGQATTPDQQILSVIGGDRSSPTILAFSKTSEFFVSDKPLPDAKNQPIILQFQSAANAPTIREKFNLNTAICPGCNYQEYACICDHDH